MNKVKIGWKEFRIVYDDITDPEDSLGWIAYSEGVIHIKNASDHGITLLHEILHGIFKYMAVERDEALVQALSMNLWNVFKDNPELLDYFKQESQ